MSSFTKLHDNILTSTIWREVPATKVVWVTLLAMADQDGIVESTIPGLAALANVSIEETESAIEKFLSPDKYSRTREREGRRVERIDGGWRLLNYDKYREKLSKEDLKRKACIRQQRHRAKVCDTSDVTQCDGSVTKRDSHEMSRMSRQAEVDCRLQNAEALNPKASAHSANERDRVAPNSSSESSSRDTAKGSKKLATEKRTILAVTLYQKYPKKVAKAAALKAIERAIATVAKSGATDKHPDFAGDENAGVQWLRGRVDAYCDSAQDRQPDKSLIPYPATWFNGARYDDDEAEWNHTRGAVHRSGQQPQPSAKRDYTAGLASIENRPQPAWVTPTSEGAQ